MNAFDNKDLLIAVLILVVTLLVCLLFYQPSRLQATTQRNQPLILQENVQDVIPQQVPQSNATRDLSVSSTGNSPMTVGILQASQVTVKQEIQDVKDPPPDHEVILGRMQEMLLKRYEAIRICGLPWLREVSFSLEKCYVHLALTHQDTKLELDEIFLQRNNSNKPTRILVEGAAGYGKTTLVCKLCSDWVNNVDYMTCFDLVIVIYLRHFKNDFNETLSSILNVDAYGGITSVLETIELNANKTLLVLEGYDEAPTTAEKYLLPILQRDQMKHVTVLVTARPSKFMTGSMLDANGYEDVVQDLRTYLDKTITIVGLLQEHQQLFLEKHLNHLKEYSSQKLVTVKDHLSKIVPPDFLACPLFLLMLVFAFRCGDISKVHSKTDLFKMVLNFIMRRFFSKHTESHHKDGELSSADIFNFSCQRPPDYVTDLSALGELALNALEKDKLFFTQEELLNICNKSKMLLHIGLLNPTIEINGAWNEMYYEPVHKSFLEFLAAYSLWISYMNNPNRFETTFRKKSFVRPTQNTASSLVFPFLCGLLGDSCPVLLKCLKPFTAEYSCWFGSLCFSLQECMLTDGVLGSLKLLFPVEWRIPWYNNDSKFSVSSEHQLLLKNALKSGNTTGIRWFLETPAILPKPLKVTVLVLVVGAQHSVSRFANSKCGSIHCSELWCDLRTPHSSTEDWDKFMEYVAHIKKDNISFILSTTYSYVWLPFVHQAALNHDFGVSKIQWLHCWIKRKQKRTLSLIISLIQKESLCGMNLLIMPYSILAPIFDKVRCAISSVTDEPTASYVTNSTHSEVTAACMETYAAESNAELHTDNVNTNDFKRPCFTDPAAPLFTLHSRDESRVSQDKVFTSILVNGYNVFKSFNELIRSGDGNQSFLDESSSAGAPTNADSSSHTFQKISVNSCAEFGSVVSEFIESLKCEGKYTVSPKNSPCVPTIHDMSSIGENSQQLFGSSTAEFTSSMQLSTTTNRQTKLTSSSTAAKERVNEVPSEYVYSLSPDGQTEKIKYNSQADSASHTNAVVDSTSCKYMIARKASISSIPNAADVTLDPNQPTLLMQRSQTYTETCPYTEKDEHGRQDSVRSKRPCVTTEPHIKKESSPKSLLATQRSTPCSSQTSDSTASVSSLSSLKDVCMKSLSLCVPICDMMNVYDVISSELPMLFENMGFAIWEEFQIGMSEFQYSLVRCNMHSTEVDDIQASSTSGENRLAILLNQIWTSLKQSPYIMNVYEHWFPSKMKNTHKLFSLLYSFFEFNLILDWLNNLPRVSSNRYSRENIPKQTAYLFRTLASLLNVSTELTSFSEMADGSSSLDCFFQTLRSLQPMITSVAKEVTDYFTDTNDAELLAVRNAIYELYCILMTECGPYFWSPSEIRTITIVSLKSILDKFETLSASILSLLEDNKTIPKLMNLTQPLIPKVHMVLLFMADLMENVDQINIDRNHLRWLKFVYDGGILLFSVLSSVVGLSHETTPILSKIVNSIVKITSIPIPLAAIATYMLQHFCKSEANEFMDMGREDFLKLCAKLFQDFYGWTSKLLQLPPSRDKLSIEWVLFMLSSSTSRTSTTQLNASAENLQGFYSYSNEAHDCLPISQSDFSDLIKSASNSKEMKNLSISNLGTLSLDIDADTLCNNGVKSWNKLKITGDIAMHFNDNTSKCYEATHLQVRSDKDNVFREQLLNCFVARSLHCNQQLLISTPQEKYNLTNGITELNISLISSLNNMESLVKSLKQIHTLGFTLESVPAEHELLSAKEIFSMFSNSPMLKRFELWNLNANPEAAGVIIEAVIETLMDSKSESFDNLNQTQELLHNESSEIRGISLNEMQRKSVIHNSHLECLMLHLDMDTLRFKTVTTIMHEHFKKSKRIENVRDIMEHPKRRLLDIVADIKVPLEDNKLSTLELVSTSSPLAWRELFPFDEGFNIKYSMPRKEAASNRNTDESDLLPYVGHQFTVSLRKENF